MHINIFIADTRENVRSTVYTIQMIYQRKVKLLDIDDTINKEPDKLFLTLVFSHLFRCAHVSEVKP
jgi:hypothetical protein